MNLICYVLFPKNYLEDNFHQTFLCIDNIIKLQKEFGFELIYDKDTFVKLSDESKTYDEVYQKKSYYFQINKLRKLAIGSWSEEPYQNGSDVYALWNLENFIVMPYNGTILAEITERIICKHSQKFLLINLFNIDFDRKGFLTIFKDAVHKVDLPKFICIDYVNNGEDLRAYLEGMVAESAGFSIKDNPNRFIPTPYRWGNQRIYQEIGTYYYWYYDFNHNENGRPHHEIFDRLGNQLGTDNMDGRLDVTKNKGYSISDILNT